MEGFSKMWINGTGSIKKDTLEKHIKGQPHKTASDLEFKGPLSPSSYQENIDATTPIGRSLTKMVEEDKKVSMVLFINSKLFQYCQKAITNKIAKSGDAYVCNFFVIFGNE